MHMPPIAAARGISTRLSMVLACLAVLVTVGLTAPAAHAASGAFTSLSLSTDTPTEPFAYSDATAPTDINGDPTQTPSGNTAPQATSNDNFSETLDFNYGSDTNDDETINHLTLTLPVADLAHLGNVPTLCTPAELATFDPRDGSTPGAGCPAGAQIGSLAGNTTAYATTTVDSLPILGPILGPFIPGVPISAPAPIGGNIYLMPATTNSDVDDIGVEVYASVLGLATDRVLVTSGPIDYALVNGEPQLTISLPLPTTAYLANESGSLLAAALPVGTTPYTLENMTQTINGETTDGKLFGLMPGSNATAPAADAVTVADNGKMNTADTPVPALSGSATGALNPVGAQNLPYNPQASASVVKDGGDALIALTATITQQADEDPSSQISVTFPEILEPNFTNAVNAIEGCMTTPSSILDPASYAGCTVVGTVTATTPLLAAPLTGQVYLTGDPLFTTDPATGYVNSLTPSLTLVFPPPFSMAITGSVTVNNQDVVTFPTVPDLPLTNLAVALTGGPGAVFMTTCTTADDTGTFPAAYHDQGGVTNTSSSPVGVSGCPPPTPGPTPSSIMATASPSSSTSDSTPATTPTTASPTPAPALGTLGGLAVYKGLTGQHPKPSFRLTLADTASMIDTVTIAPPSGLRFVNSRKLKASVKLSGATARYVSLSHGNLVVVLKRLSRAMVITVQSPAMSESGALAKSITSRKTTTLKTRVSASLVATGRTSTITVLAKA